jgi:outer membrane protein
MFKKVILLTVFLAFIYNQGFTQIKKVYTLSDAINTAMKNNSDLINARFEKNKALEKVSQVYDENLVPTLTLSSQYIRAFKKQAFEIFGQRYEVGTDNTINNTIDVSEPLPFLGTPVFSGILVAKYYAKMQDENVEMILTKIKTDVKKAFYNVLFLKEVADVNNKSLQNAEDNLSIVEARYRNGVNTEFDFLRAKVKVESLKPTLSQSVSNLTISKKLLKNAIGIKTPEDIDVTGLLTYDSTEVFGSTDDILKRIAEKNVSVRQLNISQSINKELLNINSATFLPKLYLFGQYQLSAMEDDGKGLSNYRFFSVANAGIGLSWDLNFLRNTYKKRQSEIDIKKGEETILDVKQKLKISGQNAILSMEDAKKRIMSQSETVKLAERGFELATISFKNGVLNQIDVLDAELTLNQTRLSYLQAIYDYLNAKADLESLLEK